MTTHTPAAPDGADANEIMEDIHEYILALGPDDYEGTDQEGDWRHIEARVRRLVAQRDAARVVADAASDVDGYEDFSGVREGCPVCDPPEPDDFNAARRRLYDALTEYRATQEATS